MTTIEQLAAAHDRIRTLKAQRKQRREDLTRECETHSGWSEHAEDKKQASLAMRDIRLGVGESTGITAELKELKDSIELEQDVIAGCIANLLAEGKMKAGETLEVGDFVVAPTIRVNLHAQLKLGI